MPALITAEVARDGIAWRMHNAEGAEVGRGFAPDYETLRAVQIRAGIVEVALTPAFDLWPHGLPLTFPAHAGEWRAATPAEASIFNPQTVAAAAFSHAA
jgi:hypothetical protein